MERIMAKEFSDVRPDHLARYEAAKHWLESNKTTGLVLDAGCGVGYGSAILSPSVEKIISVDASKEAAEFHKKFFSRENIHFINNDIFSANLNQIFDAIVCYEFLEHIHEAKEAVKLFGTLSNVLICSTPNEVIRPHKMEPVNPFHVRHYTPDEFEELLAMGGFRVKAKFNQVGGHDPQLRPGWDGKFMIAIAIK